MKHLLLDKEELLNVLTHGFGLLLGAGFLPVLIYESWLSDKPYATVGVVIYGLSLIVLYAMSTLYHAQKDPYRKSIFQKLDHIAIYGLIAGTYTPFILLFFEAPEQQIYLSIMWGIALVGTLFKVYYAGRFSVLSTFFYLLMGWMVVFMGKPIFEGLSEESLWWLIVGGLGYSLGTIFFLWEKLKFGHVIWHLFVLVGSASHFLAIWAILS